MTATLSARRGSAYVFAGIDVKRGERPDPSLKRAWSGWFDIILAHSLGDSRNHKSYPERSKPVCSTHYLTGSIAISCAHLS